MNDPFANKSYLTAMLKSQGNLYAALGACAIGAIAAIPLGLSGLLIAIVLFGVGEGVASLYVPASVGFRAKVDRDERREGRRSVREHLMTEIGQKVPVLFNGWKIAMRGGGGQLNKDDKRRANDYNSMVERIMSLSQVAEDRKTQIGPDEIERMHEAAIDFLSLWLARLTIDARREAFDPDELKDKIEYIDKKIQSAAPLAVAQLKQARLDYQGLLDRRADMDGKSQAIDAAMLAMPDKIEEIYQMVLAAPYSSSIGPKLEDSLSRLRLEEALEQELNTEIGGISLGSLESAARPAMVAGAAAAAAASNQAAGVSVQAPVTSGQAAANNLAARRAAIRQSNKT
jgi:hypothetical protein